MSKPRAESAGLSYTPGAGRTDLGDPEPGPPFRSAPVNRNPALCMGDPPVHILLGFIIGPQGGQAYQHSRACDVKRILEPSYSTGGPFLKDVP